MSDIITAAQQAGPELLQMLTARKSGAAKIPEPPPLVGDSDPFYIEMANLNRQSQEAKRRGSLTRGQRMRTGKYAKASGGEPAEEIGEVVTPDKDNLTKKVRKEQTKAAPEESLSEEARMELDRKRAEDPVFDFEKEIDLVKATALSAGPYKSRYKVVGFNEGSKEYQQLKKLGYDHKTYRKKIKKNWYGNYKYNYYNVITYEDYKAEYDRRRAIKQVEFDKQIQELENLGG